MSTRESKRCECGCGQEVKRRFVHGHNSKTQGPRRLDPQYRVTDQGCWEWQWCRDPRGYGRVRQGDRTRFAHQVYYEQHVGPIPDGLELDHLCSNTSCVNPAHLEPVTHHENVKRGAKLRKLTTEQMEDVCDLIGQGWQQSDIAAAFGINKQRVSAIKRTRNITPITTVRALPTAAH